MNLHTLSFSLFRNLETSPIRFCSRHIPRYCREVRDVPPSFFFGGPGGAELNQKRDPYINIKVRRC